MQKSLPNYA